MHREVVGEVVAGQQVQVAVVVEVGDASPQGVILARQDGVLRQRAGAIVAQHVHGVGQVRRHDHVLVPIVVEVRSRCPVWAVAAQERLSKLEAEIALVAPDLHGIEIDHRHDQVTVAVVVEVGCGHPQADRTRKVADEREVAAARPAQQRHAVATAGDYEIENAVTIEVGGRRLVQIVEERPVGGTDGEGAIGLGEQDPHAVVRAP